MMRSNSLWLQILALLWLGACETNASHAGPAPVRIAAAADLSHAFSELGAEFERHSGRAVSLTFGSTGLLSQQIKAGAPFDVFAAANVSFVDEVIAAGVCDSKTKQPYAEGRIAVWTRRGALRPPTSLQDLADARFERISIANPEHAPYGRAAREALQDAGLWRDLEPRLVYGENVLQALQLAESGNVEAAIVALALVSHDHENPWLAIDPRRHRPIEQTLVICTGGANRAGGEAFAHFAASPTGRALMRRHSFVLPSERLVARP